MTNKHTFKPGQSGNPKGRPKGKGVAAELRKLMEPEAPELVAKLIGMAKDGDGNAMRICMERLVAPIKDEPVNVPGLADATTLTEQGEAIVKAVAEGDITPNDAGRLMQAVASQAKVRETDELAKEIKEMRELLEGMK